MHTFSMWGVGLNVIRKPQPAAAPAEPKLQAHEVAAQAIGAGDTDSTTASDEEERPELSPEDIEIGDLGAEQSATQAVEKSVFVERDLLAEAAAEQVARETSQAWAEAVVGVENGAPRPEVPKLRRRSSLRDRICHGAASMPVLMQQYWPEWLNRPMVACLLAVAVGLVPPAKALLVGTGPLSVPFAAATKLGSITATLALLGVGASFVADGFPTLSVIGYGPLFGVIFARLVALPACAIAVWVTLRASLPSVFPSDPVFMLLVCMESCMPSAFNIVTMCTLQGVGEKQMAGALFFQNLTAMLTVTVWVAIILKLVI